MCEGTFSDVAINESYHGKSCRCGAGRGGVGWGGGRAGNANSQEPKQKTDKAL